MPFPLIALAPALISWGTKSLAVYGLARLFSENSVDDLKNMIIGWLVEQIAERAGLHLDQADPFSDASLSGAVSQRLGVTIRSLKDRAMVEEDIEIYALERIALKTGYRLTTLRDIPRLKFDITVIGLAIVQDKTGIPFTPPAYGGDWSESVKSNVLDWARAKVQTEMTGQVSTMVEAISAHTDLEALATTLNVRLLEVGSVREFSAKGLAVEIAENITAQAVTRYQMTAVEMSKPTRRALQLRDAQRRFREKWGNRATYNPVV